MPVEGSFQPRFAAVREAFERNFAERGEIGASVCVCHDGEPVVDLWGGVANRTTQTPWTRDTIGVVWSCTKGAVALAANMLAARGLIDLDAPVAGYWPEFAARGKGAIPVRWLLDHQAGLPAIRAPMSPGTLYDWDAVTRLLADETPFWTPGTRQGYHASTFGHLVGEVIRRVTGSDVGTFFRDEIAGPLGLDFHLGLPESEGPRVAPTIRPDGLRPGETPWRFLEVANREPDSIQGLTVRNTGRVPGDHDSARAHAALLPSQGGITNARGLAGMYAPLSLDGRGLLPVRYLGRLARTGSASACDASLLVGMRFSLGFMQSADNRRGPAGATDGLILSPTAFGHAGMGGSLGFADPVYRLAFGYTMNKQGRGVLLNERGQGLVDAAYRALGCSGDEGGTWM
jgi:CubicO group peptidase (beta-lactamase class C family)